MILGLAALAAASCAKPAPVERPAPPTPRPLIIPTPAPVEPLDIVGHAAPIGGGKQAVVISVNGRRVIEGTLSAKEPRKDFRGTYEGHAILAECALKAKVQCEISIDGAPAPSN